MISQPGSPAGLLRWFAGGIVAAGLVLGVGGCQRPSYEPPSPEEAAKTPPLPPPQGRESSRTATDGG